MTKLKVTLRRSALSRTVQQQQTVAGLGLRHVGESRVLENTPAVRGMVKRVLHLVEVETVAADAAQA